jgi:predicted ATPase
MDYPEDTLSGTSLGLNLLNRVAFARKQKAARVTWHTHEHIELLLALDGATVYEFSDGQTVDFTGGHYMVVLTRRGTPWLARRSSSDFNRGADARPTFPQRNGR